MKFRALSIFAGIGQAIAVCAYPSFLFFILDTLKIDDWMITGNVIIFLSLFSVVVCGLLILAYPIYLFVHNQKADAIVVFSSMAMSLAIAFLFVLFLAQQVEEKEERSEPSVQISSESSLSQGEFPGLSSKTYRHEENGFTLQYPEDWALSDGGDFVQILGPGWDPKSAESPGIAKVILWFPREPMDPLEKTNSIMIAGKEAVDTGWYGEAASEVYAGGNFVRYLQFKDYPVRIALVAGWTDSTYELDERKEALEAMLLTVSFNQ